jgi:hypothetical protein
VSRTRRLAAILAADVRGVQCDAVSTLPSLYVAREDGVGRIRLNQIDADTAKV